jgi:uncharacterized protein YyaL (SSP411 family)
MASGRIYDHIGGLYSVDEEWLVPHFEKMLYDQALPIRVPPRLSGARRAALATGRRRPSTTCCANFVIAPAGSSAEDADSPDDMVTATRASSHVDRRRVREVLGADADIALEWYEFSDEAPKAGRSRPGCFIAASSSDRRRRIGPARLFDALTPRRPLLDDKVLTEERLDARPRQRPRRP